MNRAAVHVGSINLTVVQTVVKFTRRHSALVNCTLKLLFRQHHNRRLDVLLIEEASSTVTYLTAMTITQRSLNDGLQHYQKIFLRMKTELMACSKMQLQLKILARNSYNGSHSNEEGSASLSDAT